MANKIIVLSDGTWETVGAGVVLTLTDEAYDALIDGETLSVSEIEDNDILDTKEIA